MLPHAITQDVLLRVSSCRQPPIRAHRKPSHPCYEALPLLCLTESLNASSISLSTASSEQTLLFSLVFIYFHRITCTDREVHLERTKENLFPRKNGRWEGRAKDTQSLSCRRAAGVLLGGCHLVNAIISDQRLRRRPGLQETQRSAKLEGGKMGPTRNG